MAKKGLILSTRDIWSELEIELLIEYCKTKKKAIIRNLKENIKEKDIKKNLKRGFFPKMAAFIKTKNAEQCKSKYQKKREQIISDFLQKEDLYNKYINIKEEKKKNKKSKNGKKNLKSKNNYFKEEKIEETSVFNKNQSCFIKELDSFFEKGRSLSNSL